MDEPLSNLELREQMRTQLKRLHQRLAVTTVYVTHDQTESLALPDRIAVTDHGEVHQVGTPAEIYNNSANPFVAEFIGSPCINLLRARAADGGVFVGQHRVLFSRLPPSDDLILGVRIEDVQFVNLGDGVMEGVVELVEPIGAIAYAFVRLRQDGLLDQHELLVVGVEAHGCPAAGHVWRCAYARAGYDCSILPA